MSTAKVDIKIANLSFSGEGESEWLEKLLDKWLELARQLDYGQETRTQTAGAISTRLLQDHSRPPLGVFMKNHKAASNQRRKFLATAIWLTLGGQERLSTSDVSTALSKNNQAKLTNPSDCLRHQIAKGFCQKDGKQFYVTPEGFQEIGIQVP